MEGGIAVSQVSDVTEIKWSGRDVRISQDKYRGIDRHAAIPRASAARAGASAKRSLAIGDRIPISARTTTAQSWSRARSDLVKNVSEENNGARQGSGQAHAGAARLTVENGIKLETRAEGRVWMRW